MNTLTLISPTTVRRELSTADRTPVHRLLDATGFFNPEELEVAMELVDDRLEQLTRRGGGGGLNQRHRTPPRRSRHPGAWLGR